MTNRERLEAAAARKAAFIADLPGKWRLFNHPNLQARLLRGYIEASYTEQLAVDGLKALCVALKGNEPDALAQWALAYARGEVKPRKRANTGRNGWLNDLVNCRLACGLSRHRTQAIEDAADLTGIAADTIRKAIR